MVKNSLDASFAKQKARGGKTLIAYLAAGFPRFSEQIDVIQSLVEAGVDILEIGIPFSDPIADGPTIQKASNAALLNGVTLVNILEQLARWKGKVSIPIVLMGYMNPLLRYGLKKFARDASHAGVTGLIVPDIIIEESHAIMPALSNENIHSIFLVAPTTPSNRQREIAKASSGFLYAVSVTGVTGARTNVQSNINPWLRRLQKMSPNPVAVGFGISKPDHIRSLRQSADGFIVGSGLINVIQNSSKTQRCHRVKRYMTALAKECHHADC